MLSGAVRSIPLWVISRPLRCKTACPLYPPKADIKSMALERSLSAISCPIC